MYSIHHQITRTSVYGALFASLLMWATTCAGEESESGLGQAAENAGEINVNLAEAASDQNDEAPKPLLYREKLEFDEQLAGTLPQDQVVWLEISYTSMASNSKSLALEIPAKAANTQGAILILPDTQKHADWPGLTRSLRNELAFEGWQTLSLNLPWPMLDAPPERDIDVKTLDQFTGTEAIQRATSVGSRPFRSNNEPTETPEAQEDATQASEEEGVDIDLADPNQGKEVPSEKDQARSHVKAGMNHLAQSGFQNIVVIAIRESASLALDYIKSKQEEITDKGFALVLIEPVMPQAQHLEFASFLGEEFPAPVLDIYRSTSESQETDARLRNISAQRMKMTNYSQLAVSTPTGPGADQFLLRRIAGWLDINAPGEEQGNP